MSRQANWPELPAVIARALCMCSSGGATWSYVEAYWLGMHMAGRELAWIVCLVWPRLIAPQFGTWQHQDQAGRCLPQQMISQTGKQLHKQSMTAYQRHTGREPGLWTALTAQQKPGEGGASEEEGCGAGAGGRGGQITCLGSHKC